MELLLCVNHYCNCFIYIGSFSAHEHMAGFFVSEDTVLEGISTKFDDLKL